MMKLTLLFLSLFSACAVRALPSLKDIPSQDIDLLEDAEEDSEEIDVNSINTYILYTRENPSSGQFLVDGDVESIKASNFKANVNTVVLAHGWLGNEETGMNTAITEAYLNKEDVNVIILDWKPLARRNYVTSVRGVPNVGQALGKFIAFLSSTTGASYSTMHLVGFSLGAHVVGNAGRQLEGKVARITGLDPAGPLWTVNSNKINKGDAQYVENIHTDGNLDYSLGIGMAVGDVDFFPNGGSSQPGCLNTRTCSHNRAWRFFAASITYNHFEGRHCESLTQFMTNRCRGESLNMGSTELHKNGSGRYRLKTGRRYPY
ncbi:hypothetical protein ACJJTC_017247 [Scirpophaga incertulas]